MIKEISITNFKSIEDLKIPLGRITVLIGENGCGKSNILEGIALLAAGIGEKLDNEFLISRGVRPLDPALLLPDFEKDKEEERINKPSLLLGIKPETGLSLALNIASRDGKLHASLKNPRVEVSGEESIVSEENEVPETAPTIDTVDALLALLAKPNFKVTKDGNMTVNFELPTANIPEDVLTKAKSMVVENIKIAVTKGLYQSVDEEKQISSFVIYSPEVTALRRFEEEGQIQPVGIRGEGLFKLLESLSSENNLKLKELKHSMELIGWFMDFSIPENLAPGEFKIRIRDRFISSESSFDQRTANEGFLFLLFYFSLFLSKKTPRFFAIDNIDAALNPKLCVELMRRLCTLAKTHDKQVIVTTHNPAILDGLNLNDDEQRLFAIYRTKDGRTKARRVPPPKVQHGEVPVKISDAFLKGLIGGLPKNF